MVNEFTYSIQCSPAQIVPFNEARDARINPVLLQAINLALYLSKVPTISAPRLDTLIPTFGATSVSSSHSRSLRYSHYHRV
jgi:hypothetical protein